MVENQNVYEKASVISKLTFNWLNTFFKKGFQGELTNKDVLDVNKEDITSHITEKFRKSFEDGRDKQRSYLLSLIAVYKRDFAIYALLSLILEFCRYVQTPLVVYLVRYVQGETPLSWSIVCIFGLVLSSIGYSFLHAYVYTSLYKMAMRFRAISSAFIYRKVVKLSHNAIVSHTGTGNVLTLLSTDVEKFHLGLMAVNHFWLTPLSLLVVCGLLYIDMGAISFVLIPLVAVLSSVQTFLGIKAGKLRKKIATWTDERTLFLNNICSGIQVIKMHCWENYFKDLIYSIRKVECGKIRKSGLLLGQNQAIFFITSSLITFIMMLSYLLIGNDFSPSLVVKVVGYVGLLKISAFFYMPMAFQYGTEMLASAKRIQEFLGADESKDAECFVLGKQFIEEKIPDGNNVKPYINLEQISASWKIGIESVDGNEKESFSFFLKNVDMKVENGQLAGITGTVGCGKSTLFSVILGELPLEQGVGSRCGSTSYAPQIPWLFRGTVRENILFGSEYEAVRYDKVLKACALVQDIAAMPKGDMTQVGEKGHTLSGGQQSRINLARAVYRDADIYLLDDPLSALDGKVANYVFENCIKGFLKGKICVLNTHQIQFLKQVDTIFIMKKGTIIYQNTYEDMPRNVDLEICHKTKENFFTSDEKNMETFRRMSTAGDRKLKRQKSPLSRMNSMTEKSFDENVIQNDSVFANKIALRKMSVVSLEECPLEKENEIEDFQTHDSISGKSYYRYLKAGSGIVFFLPFVVLTAAAQGAFIMADWWLALWSMQPETNGTIALNTTANNSTLPTENPHVLDTDSDKWYFIQIYVVIIVCMVVMKCLGEVSIFIFTAKAGQQLHNRMLDAVLKTSNQFFHLTPIGHIINRFSRDNGFMDDLLPRTLDLVSTLVVMFLGVLCFTFVVNPWTVLLTVPVIIGIILLQHYALPTTRNVRRLEAARRNPIYTLVSTTLEGLDLVRTFKMEEEFINRFDSLQDDHTAAWFLYLNCVRWFGIRLDWLANAYVAGCAILAVSVASSGPGGLLIGLSLTHIISLTSILQFVVRQTAELENMMTSVERIVQYTDLKPEEKQVVEDYEATPPNWPQSGAIEFQNVSLRYKKDMPYALQNLNIRIKPKEKVGICGRTGAGKSSLLTCLLRLAEPQGKILIDGIDIMKIPLHEARSKLSVIPQEPILFTGTVRENLDPFSEFKDVQLWDALAEVQLKEKFSETSGYLDARVIEGGMNLSVGEKQLFCLARAFLMQNKILLVDEATANLDPKTDGLIQDTIRRLFSDCTVLTIAHRINTIIDSDKILVLDEGRVVEFDESSTLLKSKSSHFSAMVAASQALGDREQTRVSKNRARNAEGSFVRHVSWPLDASLLPCVEKSEQISIKSTDSNCGDCEVETQNSTDCYNKDEKYAATSCSTDPLQITILINGEPYTNPAFDEEV